MHKHLCNDTEDTRTRVRGVHRNTCFLLKVGKRNCPLRTRSFYFFLHNKRQTVFLVFIESQNSFSSTIYIAEPFFLLQYVSVHRKLLWNIISPISTCGAELHCNPTVCSWVREKQRGAPYLTGTAGEFDADRLLWLELDVSHSSEIYLVKYLSAPSINHKWPEIRLCE